jgi:hypothetical protein
MRRDLLATPEGRQVYDEALLRRQKLTEAPRSVTVLPPSFRLPEETSPVPIPLPTRALRTTTAASSDDDDARGIAWPYALVAAAAVLAIVASALLAHDSGISPSRRPVAMSLSQLGAVRGSKFVSGQLVTLAWTTIPSASVYRIQIATTPGDPSDSVVFAHASTTLKVRKPTYHLKVTGQQWYYWRVQALVGGTWQHYTRSIHFAVAKPKVTKPIALAPETGVGKGGKHARLCWSPVQGAIGYRLRVQGQKTRTVHSTCLTLSVRPKTYHWSVAALVKGAGVYTGAYSVAAVLHVHPTHHAAKKSRRHHSSTHTGSVGGAKRHSKSRTAEVAVALPHHTISVSHRASTRHSTRSSRSKLRTLHRSKPSKHYSSATSTAHSPTPPAQPTTSTASVAPGLTPVRTTSVTSHRTSGGGHTTASPTHTPTTSTSPTRKHTPVVASNVPPPPAPPAPPTHAASTAVTAPTQGAATAKAAGSTSPLYVRPVVAPAVATAAPRAGVPATAVTAPAANPSSAVPTNAKSSAPTPSPVTLQSGADGHPAHPDHPEHPVHPDHPAHP